MWRGKARSRARLWKTFIDTDLTKRVGQLEVPLYFFIGRHDYTANRSLGRAYVAYLDAPLKGFYLFRNSAHSPPFEEHERARDVLVRDVLERAIRLADDV